MKNVKAVISKQKLGERERTSCNPGGETEGKEKGKQQMYKPGTDIQGKGNGPAIILY
jgi:hypothetical protein